MSWKNTWTACFESLSDNRAESIEAYVNEKCQGLAPGEFEKAVNMLAENWNPKEQGKAPGIGLLIATIRNTRKRDLGINVDEPYEFTVAKRAMRDMPVNTLERWDLICSMMPVGSGHDAQWTFKLAQYAERNGGYTLPWWVDAKMHPTGQWQMPKPKGVTGWVDAVRRAGELRREMMIPKAETA